MDDGYAIAQGVVHPRYFELSSKPKAAKELLTNQCLDELGFRVSTQCRSYWFLTLWSFRNQSG